MFLYMTKTAASFEDLREQSIEIYGSVEKIYSGIFEEQRQLIYHENIYGIFGKAFTETHQMMKKVYGNDCLSRSRIHEWFKLFQEGREVLEVDDRSGRA